MIPMVFGGCQDVSQAGQAELFANIYEYSLSIRHWHFYLQIQQVSVGSTKVERPWLEMLENTLNTDGLEVLESLDLHGLQKSSSDVHRRK